MTLDGVSLESLRELRTPFLAEYFGIWAMKEDLFRAAVERISTMDIALHVRTQHELRQDAERQRIQQAGPGDGAAPRMYRVTMLDDGIAVVDVRGALMKQTTSLDDGTSTAAVRRSVRALANDDNVKGAMIRIESPGGTSAGTQELADDIAALAARKPTHAYIEDLGASAAYWLASQASSISTNPQGWVGSIGTYATVYDYSGAAAQEGIKVHVIRAGEFKGAGTPGTEVTAPQLAEWQRLVDQTNQFFLDSVAKGRRMSAEQVKGLNDGRVHIGAEAKSLGLVDEVESFDQAMTRLRAAVAAKGKAAGGPRSDQNDTPATQATAGDVAGGPGPQSPAQAAGQPAGSDAESRKESEMSQTATAPATSEPTPKPATMAELKSACPGAPSDFLVEQAEKNATVQQAKDNFLQFQAAQIRARDEELAKVKSEAAKTGQQQAQEPRKPGVQPIGSNAAESSGRQGGNGGATEEFKSRVDAKVKAGMSRQSAVAAVAKADPQLQKEMLAEANPGRNL